MKRQAAWIRLLVLTVVLTAVVITASTLMSPVLLSTSSPARSIVIGPHSDYAVRFDFYGAGMLKYSTMQVSGPTVYMLELDDVNYQRYVRGDSYHETGYGQLGIGSGGESTESGTIWVRYLVFVNDNSDPATIVFGYDAKPTFSMLIAGPLLAAVMFVVLCAAVVSWRRERLVQ